MTVTTDAAERKARIQAGVEAGWGVAEVHARFVAFADAGGLQKDAERILSELYSMWRDSDERKADLMADVGDYVVGWCQPQVSVRRKGTQE